MRFARLLADAACWCIKIQKLPMQSINKHKALRGFKPLESYRFWALMMGGGGDILLKY